MTQAPVQRVVLWGLLVATLVAIAVTALLAPTWSRPNPGAPPPELGRSPDFELTNRDGSSVSQADLLGSVWVADFIFTRCALSCPRMTEIMNRLEAGLPDEMEIFRVSFSVDPTYDTPAVLQAYAESWNIRDPRWLFLTGGRDEIYTTVVEGFKLALDFEPPPELSTPDEPILHSSRFVLVDAAGAIRGYYNVVEGGELQRLLADLRSLAQS